MPDTDGWVATGIVLAACDAIPKCCYIWTSLCFGGIGKYPKCIILYVPAAY